MRLLPRSLFGRTLLVLAAGLLLAQMATLVVNVIDRGSSVYRLGAQQMALRIAQSARVLNAIPAEHRAEAIDAMVSGDLRVLLSGYPLLFEQGFVEFDIYERAFAVLLRRGLGFDARVTVEITRLEPVPAARDDSAESTPLAEWFSRNFYFLLPGSFSLVAQVGLKDGVTAVFLTQLPQEPLSRLENLAPRLLLWVAIFFTLGAFLVRMVTRPLDRLARAATTLGANPEGAPLAEEGPAETRRVIQAFNHMRGSVRRYLTERTQLLGAISHDLKTPITRMRLRAEMLPESEARTKFIRDLDEMEAMVGSTLEFFKSLGKEPQRRLVDIGALIESLAEDLRETGGQVEVAGAPSGAFEAHPDALRRCLGNLIENALRYGDRAQVTIEDGPSALVVRVRDDGPGIPADELERVFEPFVRLEASRNRASGGTGLGLSIARNIARWHGGDVTLANADGQGGLVATLQLPRTPTPAGAPA